MKRYVIFFVIGPFLGGFLLLFASTVVANYWTGTSPHDVGKLFSVFFKSLPYYYLFGFVPVLMYAAIDDIIAHIHRIGDVVRMLLMGVIAFFGTVLLYGFQGGSPDKKQVLLVGFAGLVPALLSSWLSRNVAPHGPPKSSEQLAPK